MACETEGEGVYALAAADGERRAVMLANIGEARTVTAELSGDFCVYIINKEHLFEKTPLDARAFMLEENTVALVKNF